MIEKPWTQFFIRLGITVGLCVLIAYMPALMMSESDFIEGYGYIQGEHYATVEACCQSTIASLCVVLLLDIGMLFVPLWDSPLAVIVGRVLIIGGLFLSGIVAFINVSYLSTNIDDAVLLGYFGDVSPFLMGFMGLGIFAGPLASALYVYAVSNDADRFPIAIFFVSILVSYVVSVILCALAKSVGEFWLVWVPGIVAGCLVLTGFGELIAWGVDH